MIKFFRKFRQKLLSENKFSKYLIYAIGEIVLVVIGILIAININNWNENLKTEAKERVYLERISKDLISDSIYFTRRLKESSECVKGGEYFSLEAYKTQNNFDEYFALVNSLCWNSEQFVIQNSTFVELKNSGQLDIISNEKLKGDILHHHLKYESIGNHIKEVNEFSVGEMSKIISIHFKGRNLTKVYKETNIDIEMDWQFINSPLSKEFIEFETAATIYRDKHKLFITYFEESLNNINLLLKQIDDELKRGK